MTNETPTSRWAAARDELRTRRTARQARRSLERDISAYSAPNEISELRAVLARYNGPEVEKIREIVDRRNVA